MMNRVQRCLLSLLQGVIDSAESLIGKLHGERVRWAEQVGELTTDIDALPTQTLLASAFIVYLPSASEDGRKERLRHWQEITKVHMCLE